MFLQLYANIVKNLLDMIKNIHYVQDVQFMRMNINFQIQSTLVILYINT